MAVSLSSSFLLLLISSLDWTSTPCSAFLMDSDHMTSSAPSEPHFTECISRDQETFHCWWSPGRFHNLSAPGSLRVFYLKKDSPTSEWKECPEYIHANRECFFDMNHTAIWVTYCMQLRSLNNITYYNEDDCFTVENIVRPDPPVALNWTLLNVSPSGLSYDIRVNWDSPPSADVEGGWMRLEYEIRYRERNATNWEALEIQPHTQQTIYGLHVGRDYEVHIRSRMKAFIKFGDFSDSIFIQVTEMPNRDTTLPLMLILVFGIVGILILIMLIVMSQQHRLVMILLPPIPAPKIKGIDSELLKKGKLDELNFILSGEGMGGLPTYAPDFYRDEPWVEFIEVDAEHADTEEKDSQASDTQRLLSQPQPIGHHMNIQCSTNNGFPDEDSGRASCYDPDLPNQDTLMVMATLLPGQPEDEATSLDVAERASTPEIDDQPNLQIQIAGPPTWVNTDFYAQVSNVMPSGGVVLSPGQQFRIQESTLASEVETQKKGKVRDNHEKTEDKKQSELQFQLLVVDSEGNGYTTESNAQKIITPSTCPMPGEGYQTIHPQTKPAATVENIQSPYIIPDSPQPQFLAPVADYTVVQEVDSKSSLLVNPPPQQTPPACLPHHPPKTLPAMPVGYITPDLLGNLSP